MLKVACCVYSLTILPILGSRTPTFGSSIDSLLSHFANARAACWQGQIIHWKSHNKLHIPTRQQFLLWPHVEAGWAASCWLGCYFQAAYLLYMLYYLCGKALIIMQLHYVAMHHDHDDAHIAGQPGRGRHRQADFRMLARILILPNKNGARCKR